MVEPSRAPPGSQQPTDEEDNEDELPCAVGLMTGPWAPLETTLVWLGWRVRTYEKLGTPFNPPADLLDPEVQAEAEEDIRIAHLVTCAMDCSSLSKAREIPIDGSRVKSQPLRDDQHLR